MIPLQENQGTAKFSKRRFTTNPLLIFSRSDSIASHVLYTFLIELS